jgi:hypothetical protein
VLSAPLHHLFFRGKREHPILRIICYLLLHSIYFSGVRESILKNYVLSAPPLHLLFRGGKRKHPIKNYLFSAPPLLLFFRVKREPPIRIMCYLLLNSIYFSGLRESIP